MTAQRPSREILRAPGAETLLPVEVEHLSHRRFEVVVAHALARGSNHLGIVPDRPPQLTAVGLERIGNDRSDQLRPRRRLVTTELGLCALPESAELFVRAGLVAVVEDGRAETVSITPGSMTS